MFYIIGTQHIIADFDENNVEAVTRKKNYPDTEKLYRCNRKSFMRCSENLG
jgi:hypothetical protein